MQPILYKSGYDIKLIQEILGHSSVNTTKIYTHLYDKEVEKTMKDKELIFKIDSFLIGGNMNTETNTIAIPQKVFKEIRWHLIHFYELDDYIKRRENQLREELFDYYHFTNKNCLKNII